MPPMDPDRGVVRPDAAVLNAAIRRLCAANRTHWSPKALAELARLRARWQAAVAEEAELAA